MFRKKQKTFFKFRDDPTVFDDNNNAYATVRAVRKAGMKKDWSNLTTLPLRLPNREIFQTFNVIN